MDGRTIVGECVRESGPDGMHASLTLADALKKLGLPLRRFKTGTPPRVNARSVDFSQMEVQTGDKTPLPFSFSTEHPPENQAVCYLTYTTEETHRVIRENLDRSPIYSGVIEGVGPRYCPSIETKIVRFPDKPRHQLFIEPMGLDTEELYIQGFSSSMPEEVQIEMLHSVKGLEHAEIMRPAYAIEYDCIDPTALYPTLEYKHISGLYGAGQFNGSSGYEEAAVQGFVAGVNAARKLKGETPFILGREQAYIGTLIDDLVTKGTNEPYRMMTSRSEYRLILRQDNADERLAPIGHELGLVSDETLQKVVGKYNAVRREIKRLEHTGVPSSDALNALLTSRGTAEVHDGSPLIALLRRPQLTYDDLRDFDAAAALPARTRRERGDRRQVRGLHPPPDGGGRGVCAPGAPRHSRGYRLREDRRSPSGGARKARRHSSAESGAGGENLGRQSGGCCSFNALYYFKNAGLSPAFLREDCSPLRAEVARLGGQLPHLRTERCKSPRTGRGDLRSKSFRACGLETLRGF